MRKILYIIVLLPFITVSQLAFVGVEGYGKNTTGGRGGAVYHVTNLNNSGAGSLRQGVEVETGVRTIVFDVSGYIDITTPLKVRDGYGNLTISGQTSPAGIALRGASIWVSDDNVIIRHIKIRPGEDAYNPGSLPPTDPNYEPDDALRVVAWAGEGGVQNLVFDSMEITWGHDGIVDIGGSTTVETKNITLSNCIFAENIDKGYGSLMSPAFNVTFKNNIWYSLYDRTPAVSSADAQGIEVINNYFFHTRLGAWYRRGNRVDFVNNVYETGSNEVREFETFRMEAEYNTTTANSLVYLSGNTDNGINADTNTNSIAIPYLTSTPYHITGVNIITTSLVKNSLIDKVGTKFYDAATIRIMNNIKNDTGNYVTDEANVGGYPTLLTTTRPSTDDDDNGGSGDDMLDAVEVILFGSDSATDTPLGLTDTTYVSKVDGSSINAYTNIEKTHFYLAGDLVSSFSGGIGGILISNPRTTNGALINN